MAKLIKYKFLSAEINHGTEENPVIEQIFQGVVLECKTQAEFDDNYPIAEKEAVPDTIDVTGEFDPDPVETPTELDVLDARLTYVEMMTGIMEV